MEQSLFWADQVARKVLEKEATLKRVKTLRTEMGMGASGISHVGSAGDGVRSYIVNLALKELGAKSEFIAFSDDRDGLRKVPSGFPRELESEIGKPVSMIRDVFGCHKSFGDHASSELMDAFDKLGMTFEIKRASIEYPKGTFDREVVEVLTKADLAGKIIKDVTGQDKYIEQLPFMPICKKCGRVYTTTAYRFNPKTKKISYKCDQGFEGKNVNTGKTIEIKGCGYEGECGIREGKLIWKVEFAARWRALKINYEAYGKDILDSVKCNDRICRELLNWEPPEHSFYELFTERSGKKISKSGGNVFTPAMWMKYASPESLRLLFAKRLGTTRVVDLESIPAFMDEVDELAKIYFGAKKVENKRKSAHLKRLYEYVNFLKPPKKIGLIIKYETLANILSTAKNKDVAIEMLRKTGHIKSRDEEIIRRLGYVENWLRDTGRMEVKRIELKDRERKALLTLADLLKKPMGEKELYNSFFDIAKKSDISIQEFFRAAYLALLGAERGPRLAQLILSMGREKVRKLLKNV